MTLQKMKKTAEDYLGTEVTGAVITVLHTSTTPSARPRKKPAKSLALRSSALSTSPPQQLWHTVHG